MLSQEEMSELIDRVYDKYFKGIKLAQYIVQDELTMLSDNQIENSLTGIPFELYSISSKISAIKSERDRLKLEVKSTEQQYKDMCKSGLDTSAISDAITDAKVMISAYDAVISRAELEMSSSKEYLMSLKKIWDNRRNIERSIPIAEKEYKLPQYDFGNKTYIT